MKKLISILALVTVVALLASCGDGRHNRVTGLWNVGGDSSSANASEAPEVIQCVNVGIVANLSDKIAGKGALAADDAMKAAFTGPFTYYPIGGTAETPAETEEPAEAVDPVKTKRQCVQDALAKMGSGKRWLQGKFLYSVDPTMPLPTYNGVNEITFTDCAQVENANCIITY